MSVGEHTLDQGERLDGGVSVLVVLQCVVLSVTYLLSSFR
jgi:hypothetical protein